jgi:hypothetical protein
MENGTAKISSRIYTRVVMLYSVITITAYFYGVNWSKSIRPGGIFTYFP